MTRTVLIFAVVVRMLGTLPAFAQPEEGSVMFSGTVSLSHWSGDLYGEGTVFDMTPNVAYFLSRNVSLGGEAAFAASTGQSELLAGPALAYYFASKSEVVPYVATSALLQCNARSGGGNSFVGHSIRLRAGLAWFVSHAIALTPEAVVSFDTRQEWEYPNIPYNYHRFKVNARGTVYSMGMGISGLLGPHKK